MKVLLKEDVDNLGYAGEVMNVADGYGRNYLIPKGIAVKASPSVLKQAHSWRDRAAVRMAEVQKEHEALAARIIETTLEFEARAGETGKLYGSVTTADIVDKLNGTLGTEIDRRKVVSDPLRQLGEHNVTIRLSRDYNPQVTVLVKPFAEEVIEEEDESAEEVEAIESTEADEIVEDEVALEELATGEGSEELDDPSSDEVEIEE
jgi:large subunit ribosomal protein L9